MALELACIQAVRKAWGSLDLRPWSKMRKDGEAIGELHDLPHVAPEGNRSAEKEHGAVPPKDQWQIRQIGPQDNETLFLIYSDDLYASNSREVFLKPQFPGKFVQIRNCGSPVELDEGWLLLTHGADAVRRYSIGAVLLDKQNPSKLLARSREKLVRPETSEREGYVPNVVYTCGAMRHNDQIILPYAVSDTFSNFATIKIAALMQVMQAC